MSNSWESNPGAADPCFPTHCAMGTSYTPSDFRENIKNI